MANSDDLFLSTKAKQIRNKQKKLEEIAAAEKKLKEKDFKPDQDFMNKIERKPAIQAEIQDLQGQIDLYIKSNPDWATKNAGPQLGEKEVHDRIVDALRLIGQMRTLHHLINHDHSLVEFNETQRAALSGVHQAFDNMLNATSDAHGAFQDQSHIGAFAHFFASLANGSENVSSGIPFNELRVLIQKHASDPDHVAKTNQRIANKLLAAQKAKQEEAEKQANAEAEKLKAEGLIKQAQAEAN